MSELRRNRALTAAVLVLLAAHGAVLLAGFLSPYDESTQNRETPFAAPMPLHFVDNSGQFHWRPFVRDGNTERPLRFFVSGSRYRLFGALPCRLHLFGVDEPARIFLFGSDGFGRDQFSRILYGGQVSLSVGLVAAALSILLGTAAGLFAGYWGGWRDEILMRVSELFLALPWLYLLLALRAFMPLTISPAAAFFGLFAVIGALGWARPARLIRAAVLSLKERPYVLAARGFGASSRYLVTRHILPDVYSILLTQAALLVPQYILAEVTLSFLGLGIGEPAASLGTMLGAFRELFVVASYWWMALPGIALLPIFYAYHVVAQSLQEQAVAN